MTHYTKDELKDIFETAKKIAREAGLLRWVSHGEGYPCGFAWIEFPGVKGSSKLGKMFKELDIRQDAYRKFYMWNPSGLNHQNMYILEAGAKAAADYLRMKGFDVFARSRLD